MATVVKCDNPECDAHYEVSSFLGGHTFTCNQCGSRVTIRDLSYSRPSARPVRLRNAGLPRFAIFIVLVVAALFAITIILSTR